MKGADGGREGGVTLESPLLTHHPFLNPCPTLAAQLPPTNLSTRRGHSSPDVSLPAYLPPSWDFDCLEFMFSVLYHDALLY